MDGSTAWAKIYNRHIPARNRLAQVQKPPLASSSPFPSSLALLSTPETHSPSAVSNFPSVTFPRPSFVYSPVYRRLFSKDTDGTSLSTIARIFDPRNEQMDTVGKSISTSPKFARIEKKNDFFIFQDYKVSRLQAFLSKRVRNEIDGWIEREGHDCWQRLDECPILHGHRVYESWATLGRGVPRLKARVFGVEEKWGPRFSFTPAWLSRNAGPPPDPGNGSANT